MQRAWGILREQYGVYQAPPERRVLAVFLVSGTYVFLAAAFFMLAGGPEVMGQFQPAALTALVCAIVALLFAISLDRFRVKSIRAKGFHWMWCAVLVGMIVAVFMFGLPTLVVAVVIALHQLVGGTVAVAVLLERAPVTRSKAR